MENNFQICILFKNELRITLGRLVKAVEKIYWKIIFIFDILSKNEFRGLTAKRLSNNICLRLEERRECQQAILADYDKFSEVGNLDQLESKLAELRTIQEAQLQTLTRRSETTDYEQQARDALLDEDLDLEDFWSEIEVESENTETSAGPLSMR